MHSPLPWSVSPRCDTAVLDANGLNLVVMLDPALNGAGPGPTARDNARLVVASVNGLVPLAQAARAALEFLTYLEVESPTDEGWRKRLVEQLVEALCGMPAQAKARAAS